MAASSAADIPESKSDYCPCNRCTVARKQGRQEIIDIIRELHKEVKVFYRGETILGCDYCFKAYKYVREIFEYPCETIKALDGDK